MVQDAFIFLGMLEIFIILFSIAPLVPLFPASHWSFRFFDFVRVQTVTIQVLLILLALFVWKEPSHLQILLLISCTCVMLYQIYIIRPYTPFYHRRKPKHKFHEKQLTLVTANVLQTNTDYVSFIQIIKDSKPDLFVTMESDRNWDHEISKAFPEYVHTLKATQDNFYGMHIYSKIPFQNSEIAYLVEDDIPSMHCELSFADQVFNFIAVHPAPPSPTENETSKERDAELMIVGKMCRERKDATVVCGDLNDVVWSKTSKLFTKMTGYLDPRIGRGLYPSFHANYWLLRFPLDHLFYSPDLHVPEMRRLKRFGSDHFAMYYKIAFPVKDVKRDNPEISTNENEEIETMIDEGISSAQNG